MGHCCRAVAAAAATSALDVVVVGKDFYGPDKLSADLNANKPWIHHAWLSFLLCFAISHFLFVVVFAEAGSGNEMINDFFFN